VEYNPPKQNPNKIC